MDRKEQHHFKHLKERELEKKDHRQQHGEPAKARLPVHSGWLPVLGAILVLLAILVWMMVTA